MRCFTLQRHEDVTGVSGTGLVAWGVEWPDRTVSMRWASDTSSFINYPGGIADVLKVHGHSGKTVVVWCKMASVNGITPNEKESS